jgi:hypothetical protein
LVEGGVRDKMTLVQVCDGNHMYRESARATLAPTNRRLYLREEGI